MSSNSLEQTRRLIKQRLANAKNAGVLEGATGVPDTTNGGVVAGSPPTGKVYVRLSNGEVVTAWHNNLVNPEAVNAAVFVTKNPRGDFAITGQIPDRAAQDFGTNAAAAYQYPVSAEAFNTPIQTRLFDLMRVTSITGLTVSYGTAHLIGGEFLGSTVDVSGNQPALDEARWVLVGYNIISGSLTQTAGTAERAPNLATSDIASIDIPAATIPLTAIRLRGDAISLTRNDLIDLRQWLFDTRHIERVERLHRAGTISTGTQGARLYNQYSYPLRVRRVHASVGTAPTGQALIVELQKNGSSIIATCSIAAGAHETTAALITNDEWAVGDYVQLNVTQVGSGTAGTDLVVTFASV